MKRQTFAHLIAGIFLVSALVVTSACAFPGLVA